MKIRGENPFSGQEMLSKSPLRSDNPIRWIFFIWVLYRPKKIASQGFGFHQHCKENYQKDSGWHAYL